VINGAYLREWTALLVVASHYNNVDLQPVSEGFADAGTNEEVNVLEREDTPAADALAQLVSLDVVLQGWGTSSSRVFFLGFFVG
jgi:hypothetical protein